MKTLLFFTLPLVLSSFISLNATITDSIKSTELMEPDSIEIQLNLGANLDSTAKLYYIENQVDDIELIDVVTDNDSFRIDIPDSVYVNRIAAIPTVVELSYNKIVRRYIEMYASKKHNLVEVMVGLSEHYFPVFDDIFDYYDVPNEMKYMSIVESALNPRAYSRARAVGLWQFMYGTGRMYDLEVNSLVDERMDLYKSTHAAARYVKKLHDRYNDWILVVAAYNCGPGNVNKAIRRAGGKSNYWDIYYYLPRETRGHIPAFIAATYIMNYYEEHNIEPRELKDLPLTCDTIQVNEKLHLEQVSKVLQLPMKQLRDLNPQYRYDIIPASKSKTYALRLPTDHALTFIDSSKAIFAYKDSIYFKNNTITKPVKSYRTPSAPGSNYTKLTYKVKANDNLGFISEWYDVRISDIRYWNNIRGNMIRSGQKLAIYKKKSVASKYSDIDKLSFAQKQARIGKQVKSSSKPKAPPAEPLKEGEYVVYTVKRGDTFWDIAKLYNVTDTQIMRWNSITNAKSLREGQKLKIKKVN